MPITGVHHGYRRGDCENGVASAAQGRKRGFPGAAAGGRFVDWLLLYLDGNARPAGWRRPCGSIDRTNHGHVLHRRDGVGQHQVWFEKVTKVSRIPGKVLVAFWKRCGDATLLEPSEFVPVSGAHT